jgi:uncharacterized protein
MSAATSSTHGRYAGNGAARHEQWLDHTRVFLQPIAAPSILGLFGFAGAMFMIAAHFAGWYGGPRSDMYLFPFVAMFGGVAQFAAGLWAYKARDGLATAMHGMWGSFFIAFGILNLLAAVHVLVIPTGTFTEFGYWFLVLAVITAFGTIAAAGENLAITAVLGTLTVGAAFAAVFYLVGGTGWERAAGWVLIASSLLATYTAGALMIASAWGRAMLPLGETRRKAAGLPGRGAIDALEYEFGEPGVKQGQ